MPDYRSPAVVANSARNNPSPETCSPLPAIPAAPVDATDGASIHLQSEPATWPATWDKPLVGDIEPHRGAVLVFDEDQDGEGWYYTQYFVQIGNAEIPLSHRRTLFHPSQEWFAAQVDKILDGPPLRRVHYARGCEPALIKDAICGFLMFGGAFALSLLLTEIGDGLRAAGIV